MRKHRCVLLVFFAVALGACEEKLPFDPNSVPKGDGFFCTSRYCYRDSKTCDDWHAKLTAPPTGVPLPPCAKESSAWCFTKKHPANDERFDCLHSEAECKDIAKRNANYPGALVSKCVEVK